jgi:Ca2+-binding RTX toxin-like protein
MTFTFSQIQRDELQAIVDSSTPHKYAAAYAKVVEFISGSPDAPANVVAWFQAAQDVNLSQGTFSEFIREYTSQQHAIRLGSTMGAVQLDAASNSIAAAVIGDILENHTLPTLANLGFFDANQTAADFFDGDLAAWSGNILFPALGDASPFTSNITETAGDTYDLLAASVAASRVAPQTFFTLGKPENWGAFVQGIWSTIPFSAGVADLGTSTNTFMQAAYGGAFPLGFDLSFSKILLGMTSADAGLEGTAGDNVVNAGAGADRVLGSAGTDLLDGGAGQDIADFTDRGALTVNVKSDPSAIAKFNGTVTSSGGLANLFNFETISGSSTTDSFLLHNVISGLTLDGGAGVDTLSAFYIDGGATIDAVHGTVSSGAVSGGITGFEKFEGGAGSDDFIVDQTAQSIDGRDGKDFADFSLATAGVHAGGAGAIALTNVEVVFGSGYQDEIVGDNGKNELFGRGGNDKLVGGGGSDALDGGDGVDDLTGGDGADYFVVGQGDTIWDPQPFDLMGTSLTEPLAGVATRPEGSSDPYMLDGFSFKDLNGTLYVTQGATVIALVMDWQSGDLGITLQEEPNDPPPNPPWIDPNPIQPPPIDPLVLDLGGNGLSFVAVDASTANFDLNEDGFSERVGWVRPSDGFLVRDANANGVVDSHAEMFGGNSQDGYQALGELDSNDDGVIDAGDAQFAQLNVWRDLNQDGVSQSGELTGLAQEGIVSLSLTSQASSEEVAGIGITATSTFQRADGSEGATASVLLSRQPAVSVWTPPSGFQVDPDAAKLPELRGYGVVKDLSAAATLDSTLLTQEQALVNSLPTATIATARAGFESLITHWAGADGVAAGSRGTYIDAKHLAVVETFMGTTFSQHVFQQVITDPTDASAPPLEALYQNLVDAMFLRFMAQAGSAYAAINGGPLDATDGVIATAAAIGFDPTRDQLLGNMSSVLDTLAAGAPNSPGAAQAYYSEGLQLLRGGLIGHELSSPEDLVVALLPHLQGLSASARAAVISAGLDLALQQGSATADELYASAGANMFIGGGGDDVLHGGAGSDTYFYAVGDGQDRIVADRPGGQAAPHLDTLVLGPGVTAADLIMNLTDVSAGKRSVQLTFTGHAGSVVLDDQLSADGRHGVDQIRFADGTVVSRAEIVADFLQRSVTAGDDLVVGGDGDETIAAGTGDDALAGGSGSDQYLYAVGDGNDVIDEKSSDSGNDRIVLGAGIAPTDLVLSNTGDALKISFANHAGSITLLDQGHWPKSGIEEVAFDGGPTWTAGDLISAYFAQVATAGDDDIIGFNGSDTIAGGAGSDTLHGGDGADTYLYNAGDGVDEIDDEKDFYGVFDNTLQLGAGLDPSSTHLLRTAEGALKLDFGGGDAILLDFQLEGGGVGQIKFANGVTWTRDQLPGLYLAQAATPGDDLIIGLRSNDTLAGGQGDDTLQGGDGADDYIYALGDGQDVILDSPSNDGHNRLVLAAGIDPGDVSYSRSGDDFILTFSDGGKVTLTSQFQTYYGLDEIVFSDGTVIHDTEMAALVGGPTAGNDTLYGDTGENTLTGGAGDDLLIGGDAGDTYIFAVGDGADTIQDDENYNYGEIDTLELGAGITPGAVVVARDGDDALLSFGGGDAVRLIGQFTLARYSTWGVESIHFSTGVTWSREQLQQIYLDTAATSGDDVINAFAGNDTLSGGQGDDLLNGSDGSDNYQFAVGDGHDRIEDFGNSGSEGSGGIDTDTLSLGAGLSTSGLSVTREGETAILHFAGGESVRLEGEFATGEGGQYRGDGIDQIAFSGGPTWSRDDLMSAYLQGASTSGPDLILGGAGAETLAGGQGADTLQGGGGSDRYVWNLGDGSDVIDDGFTEWPDDYTPAPDTLRFGPGILPADVTVERVGWDALVHVAGDPAVITIRNHFIVATTEAGGFGIETFSFDNGATWSRSQIDAGLPDDVFGTAGDDSFTGTGSVDVYWGGDGADTVGGGAGGDALAGQYGQDQLNGGQGDDFLWGGGDDDTLDGGAGDDTAIYDHTLDNVLVFRAADGGILVADGWGGDGVDRLIDVEYLRFNGDGARVALSGLISDYGTSGNDGDLQGTGRFDALYGLSGDDSLSGGAGDDSLDGGEGDDHLAGGSGGDVFMFVGDFGHDVIEDFNGDDYDIVAIDASILADFSEVLDKASQSGADVAINIDATHSILLKNVALANLQEQHFQFS